MIISLKSIHGIHSSLTSSCSLSTIIFSKVYSDLESLPTKHSVIFSHLKKKFIMLKGDFIGACLKKANFIIALTDYFFHLNVVFNV